MNRTDGLSFEKRGRVFSSSNTQLNYTRGEEYCRSMYDTSIVSTKQFDTRKILRRKLDASEEKEIKYKIL